MLGRVALRNAGKALSAGSRGISTQGGSSNTAEALAGMNFDISPDQREVIIHCIFPYE